MSAGTKAARWQLLVLCLTSAGWAFSFGLGAPLASLWLHEAGLSAKLVGLNTSCYYLGVALASPVIPWLMARNNRGCLVAGMLVDALATALFPWTDSLCVWFGLRLAGGVASAMSLIPMETRVNHNAPPRQRARHFGLYAFSVALGVGLGMLAGLLLYPLAPRLAFALGGLVTLAAALAAWVCLPAGGGPVEVGTSAASLVLRRNLLSLGTAWAQGFLEGGTLTFLSIYLLGLGHSEPVVSGMMAGLFLGVVLIQIPLACVADRLGRLQVLLCCHLILLLGLGCLPFCATIPVLTFWLFVVGATCAALYPLGLALLGDHVPPAAAARANAWYLACNCAGSLSGPVLIGGAIDLFGPRAQFAAGSAAVVLVVVSGMLYDRPAAQYPADTSASGPAPGPRRMAG
jgi:MFS family permease